MPLTPEENKAYNKQYYEANKERILADRKKWREKNKEKEAARHKQYREENKEKSAAYGKQYREDSSKEWHRSHMIGNWKGKGVVHDDYNALYDQYMVTTQCADCDVVFGKKGDGTGTFKCLDHCHTTHAFRAVVCCACNTRRGFVDKKLRSVKTLDQQEGEKEAGHAAPEE